MPPATLQVDTVHGVELLRIGKGHGRNYTRQDLDHVLEADSALRAYGYMPSFKLGHNPEQSLLAADGLPSAGTMTPLRMSEDGQAVVTDAENVPKRIAELIQVKGYGPRSAELWIDQELIPGQRFPMALRGAAWLGADAPALKNLNDIEALYHRDFAPAAFLDDEGRQVTVVDLADAGADPEPAADITNADSGDREKAKAAQEARSKRYGIAIKGTTNVTKPGQWSSLSDSQFGDPVNYRFPMGDKAHANNAASRFAQNDDYSSEEKAKVGARIKRAQSKFGTKAATENNADDTGMSMSDLYAAIQEELEEQYPCAYDAMGMPTPEEGPSPAIVDLYPDAKVVITRDQDYDALWRLEYTVNGYDVELSNPQLVKVQYVPIPTAEAGEEAPSGEADTAMSDRTPVRTGGTDMDEAEIRQLLGLDEDADIKQALIASRTASVSLSDHNAVVERLQALEADRKLTEATALVEEMVKAGQIHSPDPEKQKTLKQWASNLCLSDRTAFDTWKSIQPKVIDYTVLGDGSDAQPPRVLTAGMGNNDLARANRAFGVTPEDLATADLPMEEQRRLWRERRVQQATESPAPLSRSVILTR